MRRIAATLYVLSSITVLAGAAVAPALAEISGYFPQADPVWIKMIITLPALAVIPCTMVSSALCARFGKKRVLLGGLVLYFLGGCGGGLVDNLWLLLGLRAVLGMGMGIITPVCHALPADFFSGQERVTVVSRMSAFVTIGACVCSIGAGWLALVSWRASFAVYAVSLAVIVLVGVFLPGRKTQETVAASPAPGPLPLKVWGLACGMLAVMAVFYVFPTGIAAHLETAGIGDAGTAGLILALVSLVAFLTSLNFGNVTSLAGKASLPLFLASMGMGYILVWQAGSLALVLIGSCLTGMGLGGLTPLHFVAANHAVGKERIVRAMSLVIAGNFSGQFLSPFLSGGLERVALLPGSGTAFGVLGHVLTGVAVALMLRLAWGAVRRCIRAWRYS